MQVINVVLIRMAELENHDSLIQPAACGQGINGLDLIELNVCDNKKIISISFMKNLKVLNASYDCGINQNGIDGLELVELNVDSNFTIENVSFMKTLKILNAESECGIDQNGIAGLDLIELFVTENEKITNVSFMKNLKKLNANWRVCAVDQNGRIRESRFSNSTCRFADRVYVG
jgi:hypothetical protein